MQRVTKELNPCYSLNCLIISICKFSNIKLFLIFSILKSKKRFQNLFVIVFVINLFFYNSFFINYFDCL